MYTPIDVNVVLVAFFFDFISLFSSEFCVCEDANVTHKVSIVKKNVGFVCDILLWYLLLSRHHRHVKNGQHCDMVFGVKLGVICKWRRIVVVVKLKNHSK